MNSSRYPATLSEQEARSFVFDFVEENPSFFASGLQTHQLLKSNPILWQSLLSSRRELELLCQSMKMISIRENTSLYEAVSGVVFDLGIKQLKALNPHYTARFGQHEDRNSIFYSIEKELYCLKYFAFHSHVDPKFPLSEAIAAGARKFFSDEAPELYHQLTEELDAKVSFFQQYLHSAMLRNFLIAEYIIDLLQENDSLGWQCVTDSLTNPQLMPVWLILIGHFHHHANEKQLGAFLNLLESYDGVGASLLFHCWRELGFKEDLSYPFYARLLNLMMRMTNNTHSILSNEDSIYFQNKIKQIIAKGQAEFVSAVSANNIQTVTYHLNRKIDPNFKNLQNDPVLCVAAEKNFYDMSVLLLKSGADPEMANHEGKTPAQLNKWLKVMIEASPLKSHSIFPSVTGSLTKSIQSSFKPSFSG